VNNTTLETGWYLDSFIVTLSDAQLAAAVMPLRLEAFLFESPVASPLNPADLLRYSYYDAAGLGDPGWRVSFNLSPGESRTFPLALRTDFP
jgi:hypothetical protein